VTGLVSATEPAAVTNGPMSLGWLWYGVVAALVVGLSLSDWRSRRVANGAVAALLAAALLLVVFGHVEPGRPSRLVVIGAAAAVFTGAVLLYRLGLIAAGDAKLALPLALLMIGLGGDAWLIYLGTMIAVGLVIGVKFVGKPEGIPLAPVLGLGVVPALLVADPAALF
jgi:Flp pilus assembly protein protease CpaA